MAIGAAKDKDCETRPGQQVRSKSFSDWDFESLLEHVSNGISIQNMSSQVSSDPSTVHNFGEPKTLEIEIIDV